MKRILCIAIVFLLTIGAPLVPTRGDEQNKGEDKEAKGIGALMEKKLEHAQKVLKGVAIKDFKLIRTNAEDLIDISKQVEWKVLKTSQYELHSNEFRRNAEELVKNAKDKNLDAAALSYVEMTLTCVRCHKYVREERMTLLDR